MNRPDLRHGPWRVWGVCLAAAVVVTVLVYVLVIAPAQESRRQDAETSQRARAQAEDARRLQARVDTLHHELQTIRHDLDAQRIELGDPARLNQRIAWLIELARGAGMEVLQLQPGGEQPTEDYTLRAMRLETNATLAQQAGFLRELHEAFPDMSVVGLDITQTPGAGAARPRAVFHLVWFTKTPRVATEGATADAGRDPR